MQEKSSSPTERWHSAKLQQLVSSSVKGKPRNLSGFLGFRLTGQSLGTHQAAVALPYLWLPLLK